MHSLATAAVGVNKFLRADSAQRSAPLNAPAPDAELRLRVELAEQQVAELKAALANIKGERDRWRTLAEPRSSLLHQRAESNLARSEMREWWWRLTEGS